MSKYRPILLLIACRLAFYMTLFFTRIGSSHWSPAILHRIQFYKRSKRTISSVEAYGKWFDVERSISTSTERKCRTSRLPKHSITTFVVVVCRVCSKHCLSIFIVSIYYRVLQHRDHGHAQKKRRKKLSSDFQFLFFTSVASFPHNSPTCKYFLLKNMVLCIYI